LRWHEVDLPLMESKPANLKRMPLGMLSLRKPTTLKLRRGRGPIEWHS